MQRLTKWAARIEAPQEAPRLLAEAFRQMASGRPRPVALEVPMDVLAAEAWLATDRVTPTPIAPPEPDPEGVERAAALLNAATAPMIFAGGGAQGASPLVRQLAERPARRWSPAGWARA
jgi:acetolactate synthase-1/2/3 large subunit